MAPYTVQELQTRAELDAVVEVMFKAQYTPYLPSIAIYFPVFGYTKEARAAGIVAAQDRLWKENLSSTSSHWIFIRDEATGDIIAGTLWEWNERGSPFKNGISKIDCYWWPDVEARIFCEEMLRHAVTPRCIWMQRPRTSEEAHRQSMPQIKPATRLTLSN